VLGLLVVTHGGLAEELVAATRRIVGEVERLEAVSIDWNDDPDDAARRIREGIRRVRGTEGAGVLILTDMFGGTPTNLALSMLEPGLVENVSGVNLPMLIKFMSLRAEADLASAATAIAEQGRESIQVASRLLDDRAAPEPPAAG
jgi:PTS system mannose-specific IIA component